ncbi:MAG: arginine N-succinyltransferase [Myxococcales bacterium]|nr:arginine N-succinyltransferase [Myxococcales bacterium]MCB9523432.1 arginine N-succinyltransferase [Myxococcales bacterium]
MSSTMRIIRPARTADLDALVRLAASASVGLTTLPADRTLLAEKIRDSQRAFEAEVRRPAGETYLLVLEDLLTGRLEGTAGVVARVGGFDPFYSYRLQTSIHRSEQLGVVKPVRTLQLEESHKGPSEIGTLFLDPHARGAGVGRLLSLSRFLLVAAAPERFAPKIIAEMRGVLDGQGRSPFWEAVGHKFFDMPFAQADALSAADKSFIGDLMPKHPLYIPLLPDDVQAVIGRVHEETRPALRLLEQEGFTFAEQVDIFDAGPMMEAPRDRVRTLAESRVAEVSQVLPAAEDEAPVLISNERLDFRACIGAVTPVGDDRVAVPRDVALALGVRLGDRVRYVPARPTAERLRDPSQGPAHPGPPGQTPTDIPQDLAPEDLSADPRDAEDP